MWQSMGTSFTDQTLSKDKFQVFGNGLFGANGKAHGRQKRMIGPAFSSKNLKGFLGIFKENVQNLVKVIYQNELILVKQFLL